MRTRSSLLMAGGAALLGLLAALVAYRTTGVATTAPRNPAGDRISDPGARAARRVAPPLLSPTPVADGDDTTPGSPNYHPEKYVRGIGTKRVFEHEPRNERWAAPVERHLTPAIARDAAYMLHVDPQKIYVECRTTTCRLSLPDGIDMDRALEMMRVLYLSNASQPDRIDKAIYLLYSGGAFDRQGDPDYTIAKIDGIRRRNASAVARRHPIMLATLKKFRPEEFPQP